MYPFEYFDVRTRRWWRARYVCQFWEISERYAAFRIIGAPEVRDGPDDPLALTAGHLARPH